MPAHIEITQRKQHVKVVIILGQATIAHLSKTKLTLDHPEGVSDFGPDACLEGIRYALWSDQAGYQ